MGEEEFRQPNEAERKAEARTERPAAPEAEREQEAVGWAERLEHPQTGYRAALQALADLTNRE